MKTNYKPLILAAIPLIILGAFFIVPEAFAQGGALGKDWAQYIKGVGNFNAPSSISGEDLAVNFIKNAIRIVRSILGGVALLFAIIYGIKLVIARGQEETITKQKQNFIWIFMGFLILMVSEQFANILNPESSVANQLINFQATNDQLRMIASYIKWLLASILVLTMTISGLRMVLASGDEEKITKEKMHLTWGGIGILIVLLADNIINAFYVVNNKTGVFEGANTAQAPITEIGGVIKLILSFLGPIALLFTIYAGFMYLTSFGDEEKSSKAKRMITAGLTGIILIYAAFAIVNTFFKITI